MLQKIKILYEFFFPKDYSGRIEMVRYNKQKDGHRKDTLYTKRYDGKVFYGVARLKTKSDDFDRTFGIQLAKERANKALQLYKKFGKEQQPRMTNCGLSSTVHTKHPVFQDTEYGWLPLSEVKQLLKYFRHLSRK